jgi:hypothetical protein
MQWVGRGSSQGKTGKEGTKERKKHNLHLNTESICDLLENLDLFLLLPSVCFHLKNSLFTSEEESEVHERGKKW